jgi:hypothetical protein
MTCTYAVPSGFAMPRSRIDSSITFTCDAIAGRAATSTMNASTAAMMRSSSE